MQHNSNIKNLPIELLYVIRNNINNITDEDAFTTTFGLREYPTFKEAKNRLESRYKLHKSYRSFSFPAFDKVVLILKNYQFEITAGRTSFCNDLAWQATRFS